MAKASIRTVANTIARLHAAAEKNLANLTALKADVETLFETAAPTTKTPAKKAAAPAKKEASKEAPKKAKKASKK